MAGTFTKLTLGPLLLAQGARTRRRALQLPEAAGPRQGLAGDAQAGASPLRLLIVGDSSAAGVGAPTQDEALAGQLAQALVRQLGQPVAWQLVARTGLTTQGAIAWLQERPPAPCDVVLVVLGVNDVLAQVPPARAVAEREALWHHLRERCRPRLCLWSAVPPLEQFPLLPWPLRSVLGHDARRLNEAQARWAVERGIMHVALPGTLPDGRPAVAEMAEDGFHPGPALYRRWGEALAALIAQRWQPAGPGPSAGAHLPTLALARRT